MSELTVQQRTQKLFEYLKELVSLRTKKIKNISDYEWKLPLSELLNDPENIEISYRDRVADEPEDLSAVLVRVKKPVFSKCPAPDECFADWLEKGWDNYRNGVNVKNNLEDDDADGDYQGKHRVKLFDKLHSEAIEKTEECFEDDENRVESFTAWLRLRDEWVEHQKTIEHTRELFSNLYNTYVNLNREIETKEIVIANGFLMDANDSKLNHPVLTRKVTIKFDADENEITIEDLDVETALYTLLFQDIEGIDLDAIQNINNNLKEYDYHPMDRNDTPDFLKMLVQSLSSESLFSKDSIPEGWANENRFLMYLNPVFIYRNRVDGTPRFLDNIIDTIEETNWIPSPIRETVEGGKIDIEESHHELTIEEHLAAVGGEDIEILLAKEANREQLEIAQRIENFNAVLVQGPPGTGKTHTIANLMGHFLAKGQSILVTSQTPKALQVLKDKLPDDIKPLCVSVINDSNVDMERSVDGITSFMGRFNSYDVKKIVDEAKETRLKIIKDLSNTRKTLYSIINQEGNNIVFNGEEISPSNAAKFVFENERSLGYIPGKVVEGKPLPLTSMEVQDLYKSNGIITETTKDELDCNIPSPQEIASPREMTSQIENYQNAQNEIKEIADKNGWKVDYDHTGMVNVDIGYGFIHLHCYDEEKLDEVEEYVNSFGAMEEWMKLAAVDGKRGGDYLKRWEMLIAQIETTCACSETVTMDRFGREINDYGNQLSSLKTDFEKIFELYEGKGKITKFDLFKNRSLSKTLESVTIDGHQIQNKEECRIILDIIELDENKKKCSAYWNELIAKNNGPRFLDLDPDEPERIAGGWVDQIKQNLKWYDQDFDDIEKKLNLIGLTRKDIFVADKNDSGIQATEKILSAVRTIVPPLISICRKSGTVSEIKKTWNGYCDVLKSDKRADSFICKKLIGAIDSQNIEEYSEWYQSLEDTYNKYHLQEVRESALLKLEAVAPDWAKAIRLKSGIHGNNVAPENVEDAWKWKQYESIISRINATSYSELQDRSSRLSKEYRKVTATYAGYLAWYHLLKRTENDIDMRQALNGWKLTVRKIGKGTGKSAPKYKAQARKLMAKCQEAVPAWIMPMSRVVDSLDPHENRFDVIIVDEASQSDVSALGVMYLGKKIIIVGDDKQVSPMAIGVEQKRTDALESMYIKGLIPNSHLYGANTSLYDIAATTYQPLMLREHFRCVPEIIGFSNMLSYDYKIKPLRDAGSSNLLPAVVSYRVEDGVREIRTNRKEAETVVALMKACIDQPEYKGKTFGVIGMLGDTQHKIINQLIFEHIGPREVEQRKILCGNPSHFQGDERDVIFMSLVDSRNDEGPLPKMEFGPGEAYRKRYNVAASRAKDQLWVVHSLDSANDLKPGDIRKRMIDYSINPSAFEEIREEIEHKADSPFEIAVATALTDRGYKLVQQWPVGAYRIDMVAVSGQKHIAIECDGERYHSGETKIREDMERQAILERSGWKFIRIRGSEFFRSPQAIIDKVEAELNMYGIKPELRIEEDENRSSDLLQRVKIGAARYLDEMRNFDEEDDPEDIKETARYYQYI